MHTIFFYDSKRMTISNLYGVFTPRRFTAVNQHSRCNLASLRRVGTGLRQLASQRDKRGDNMAKSEVLLTPREAAAEIGVSYATVKQWILAGKLTTSKTPGGHHRIPQSG